MPLIGQPIGDIDQYLVIPDIYTPDNFKSGWYFMPHNFPFYQLISTDTNPFVEEVFQIGDKVYVEGFEPYLPNTHYPSGVPVPTLQKTQVMIHYPSGLPFDYQISYYWELFSDLNNPYLFIPYFDPSTYGQIVWLDMDTPLQVNTISLPFIEKLLNGLILPFSERIVSDASYFIPLKEKIVSLLSCDIKMVAKNRLKLTWNGEKVPQIEVLRKEVSDKDFGSPIATVPFEDGEYVFTIDNNSYIYSVRGSHDTGMSNVEITIGVQGLTTIHADLDLGDFVKIYEAEIEMVDTFEVDIYL